MSLGEQLIENSNVIKNERNLWQGVLHQLREDEKRFAIINNIVCHNKSVADGLEKDKPNYLQER